MRSYNPCRLSAIGFCARKAVWQLALLLLCAGMALVLCGCERRQAVAATGPQLLLDSQRIKVSELRGTAPMQGGALRGSPGDFVVQTPELSVVVGGNGSGPAAELSRGAILDAAAGDLRHEGLDRLSIALFEDQRELPLQVLRVETVQISGRPALTILHRSVDDRVRITTECLFEAGKPYVELVSHVQNQSGQAIHVRFADRVRFTFDPPFGPGVGDVEASARASLSWFGVSSRNLSYALVFPESARDVAFEYRPQGVKEELARGSERTIPAGAAIAERRYLVVLAAGRAELAERAFALSGAAVGYAIGTLSPMPAWATLELSTPARVPILKIAVPETGQFRLALPEGPYRAVLRVPGGTDEQSLFVQRGRETESSFLVPIAHRLHYRVSESGQAIPARLVIRGLPPTANPELGPAYASAGAGNVTYTASGEGSVELPPGRYHVLATHGIEYSTAEAEADVSKEAGKSLRFSLDRVVDTPGFLACDFHLHARPSGDSEIPLPDRVVSLLAEGIEFAVATDHNRITDYAASIAELDAGAALTSARGVEITTQHWGHFNAYPFLAAEPPRSANVSPRQIFAEVRSGAAGALIQVNHPRMGEIGYFNRTEFDDVSSRARRREFSYDFDTLEVWNGFEHDRRSIERNLADWFSLLNSGHRYTAVGNSDSHRLIVQFAGYPRTYVAVPEDVQGAAKSEAVIAALRAGRAIVTGGPFITLHAGQGAVGDVVPVPQGRVVVELAVDAPDWMQVNYARLVLGGKTVRELAIPPPAEHAPLRVRYSTEVGVEQDTWLVAIVSGTESLSHVLPGTGFTPFAFTNPIYFDRDGGGVSLGHDRERRRRR